jgi:hypothetical protein
MRRTIVALVIMIMVPAAIQPHPGADYRLDEHSLNAGGRPAQAVFSSSPGYRLGLESIGDPIIGCALSGASFRLQGGLVPAYLPPGEVAGLAFLPDQLTLTWLSEPASTVYDVYSGSISSLPGGYGFCAATRVAGISWIDATTPAPGNGLFYLVTGVNRLREEGTKGHATGGAERGNPAPCP